MATKVKPSRLQITGTPQAGNVPVYVDQDTFQWGAGGGGGSGDVSGPASSTDGDVVLFDGTTGKLIKDSGITLGTAATKDTGTSSGNVPILDASGKLATTVLPGLALTDTFTVTNKSELTSLSTAQQGDIGIVTSESKTYVLSTDPYSTAANWKELLTPTDTVTSVNSKTGAVVLNADDISDSTTTNKFVTATDKTTWSGKQDALTLPATPAQGHLVTWGANNKSLVDGGAIPTGVPTGGSIGQLLTWTGSGPAWMNGIMERVATLTAANWSSKTQTVNVMGVTASNVIIVSPDPANINDYASNSVYCSSQGSGTLTFSCNTEPTVDIVVNILTIN